MKDQFKSSASGLTSPAQHGFSIIPDDVAELPEMTRGIYVGVSGHLSVVLKSGATIDFANVQAGSVLPLRANIVRATGTTAQNIVGLA